VNSLQQQILQYRGTTYYQFPLFLCLFVQAEAQILQKNESHSIWPQTLPGRSPTFLPKWSNNWNISNTISDMQPLAGMFTKMLKITIGLSCMPVHMEQLGSHCMNFHEIWNFEEFVKTCWGISSFMLNLTWIMWTLHESPCKFTISCWIILGIWNVSYESCTDNQNIHCTVNFFFQKINAVYEMRKTMVQITQSTERMQYACQITKARIQTHTLIFYIDC